MGCLDDLYDGEGSQGVDNLFYIGIIISLISSASTNLGANIQKLALNREERRPLLVQRSMYRIPLWIAGFVLFVGSQGGDALALYFAPQSVAQPVGSVSLLANMWFGWAINDEPIGRVTPLATLVIISGVAAIVSFGPKQTVDWGVQQITARWHTPTMILYACVVGGLAISLLALLHHFDRRIERRAIALCERERQRARASSVPAATLAEASDTADAHRCGSVGSSGGGGGVASRPIDCLSMRDRRLVTVLYPLTAAIVGSWTPLLMKQFLLLLAAADRGEAIGDHAATYLIAFGCLVSGILQLVCLAKGLRNVEAQLMVPAFASLFTVFSITGAAFFFQELSSFCAARVALFILSAVFCTSGVVLLYCGRMPRAAKVGSTTDAGSPYRDDRQSDSPSATKSPVLLGSSLVDGSR